jgi:hypothetical protein
MENKSSMKQKPSSPIKGQEDLASPQSKSPRRRTVLKVCVVILALTLVFALALFRIYGTNTHHASRGSIWWPERGRNLIPPTAADITLRRDPLDHYATYTVSGKDLKAFLSKRFGPRTSVKGKRLPAADVGKAIGPLRWVATKDTLTYHGSASNGGGHRYYHDSSTGRTYQSSAYW